MNIPEFYENAEIFITGGSGVVGKALIDLILRTCNVKRIHVLLRTKRNLDAEQRLEKLRNAKIFRKVRATRPEQLSKIQAVPGDSTYPMLGITPEYAKMLENVSIVFHCAATVRFDEPLGVALQHNVFGTLEALKFAESLKTLKIFMHVSTFYSNPYLDYVEPKVYPPPMDWKLALEALEQNKDNDMLDFLTRKMITGFPNTYTFTKNLAESLVNDYSKRLPITIFRPSIVISSASEPEPGFPPNTSGAVGLFFLVGLGLLKTVYIGDDVIFDLTQLDLCAKTMLYFARKAAIQYEECTPDAPPVYIFSSARHILYAFSLIGNYMQYEKMWENTTYLKSFLLPYCHFTASRCWYIYHFITKQLAPALIVDTILTLCGRKPTLVGIYRKIYNTLEVMQPFMFNTFRTPGITDYDALCADTKGTIFDISEDLDKFKTYDGLVEICTKISSKMSEVFLKEDDKSRMYARKVQRVKKIFYRTTQGICAYFALRWMYNYALVAQLSA